ncbi:MAG: PEGA domain-containing protein, partial [Gemmatimonadales bacterium]
ARRDARRRGRYAVAGLVAALLIVAVWSLNRRPAPVAAREPSAPAPVPAAPTPPPAPQTTPAVAPPAKLRLLTSPPSARILIDNEEVGVGGLFDWRVPAGARRLRIAAAGYVAWDTTIVFRSGETRTLGRIALRPRGMEQ